MAISAAPRQHAVELPLRPDAALGAVARAADDWGAEYTPEGWTGGRLVLPVVAGLRRGLVTARVTAAPAGDDGTRLVLAVEEAVYRLHLASIVLLLLALAGAVTTVVWPFFPRLLAIAPLGLALALAAWLLVIARLANSGPEEFLAQVAAAPAAGERR